MRIRTYECYRCARLIRWWQPLAWAVRRGGHVGMAPVHRPRCPR